MSDIGEQMGLMVPYIIAGLVVIAILLVGAGALIGRFLL